MKYLLICLALFGAGCAKGNSGNNPESYCNAGVIGVADCGEYVQTVAAKPNGALTFVKVSNNSNLSCSMDAAEQSAACKQILSACKNLVTCPARQ